MYIDICDINQLQNFLNSTIHLLTWLLYSFAGNVEFLCFFAVAVVISTPKSIPLIADFFLSIHLKFILRLLHFSCALEFVRLNFSDPYLVKIYKRKTLFIYWHIWITRRILHTQIELNFQSDTPHFPFSFVFITFSNLIRMSKKPKTTTIPLINYFLALSEKYRFDPWWNLIYAAT